MTFCGGGGKDPTESLTEDLNKFHQSFNGMEWISLNIIPRNGLGQSLVKNIRRR